MFDLASALLNVGAVRLSPEAPFTWASGMKAPIYCDNRRLLGHPELRTAIAQALAERARTFQPTLIAGTSTAGIPWAAFVADRLSLPLAYVRPEPKAHGMGRQVEGPSPEGHRIVLIEDLLSTGGSSLKCVQGLRAEGGEVLTVLALFSYGLPKAEHAFHVAGVPFHVLATFQDLVDRALAQGHLGAEGHAELRAWRADASGWSEARGGAR